LRKVSVKKKNKVFMVGFHAIKAKVGLTVKQENLVVDKKVKKEEAILHVAQQSLCVIPERNTRKVPKEFLGRKVIKHHKRS
jgi:hypothetical protein